MDEQDAKRAQLKHRHASVTTHASYPCELLGVAGLPVCERHAGTEGWYGLS
jgi:hypothetical protein